MAAKTKFRRVATEGATTDGRNIERAWIQQMAKNFDPKKYGARIWLEHIRGILPDSNFKALGDVTAVEARAVEDGKLALFAQLEPLPELVAMNKAKQKIYSSIEIHPNFADTGQAYLTGIAVTDSPASLGTEVLEFAAKNPDASPFKARKSAEGTLFSAAVPLELEFEESDDNAAAKFGEAVKGVMARFTSRGKSDDARFSELLQGFEKLGEVMGEQAEALDSLTADHANLSKDFTALQAEHEALKKTLGDTPEQNHTQRPPAAGGSGLLQTDC